MTLFAILLAFIFVQLGFALPQFVGTPFITSAPAPTGISLPISTSTISTDTGPFVVVLPLTSASLPTDTSTATSSLPTPPQSSSVTPQAQSIPLVLTIVSSLVSAIVAVLVVVLLIWWNRRRTARKRRRATRTFNDQLNAASGQRTGPDEDGEGQVVTVPTARFSTSERTLFTIQSPKRFRQDNIRTRPWSPDWEAPKPPPLVPPDVEPVPPLPTYQPPPSATSSKRSTIIPARMVNRPIIPLPVPRPTDSTYGNPGLPLAPRPARQQMQSSPKLQPEVQSPPPSHLPVSPRAPRATLSAVAGSFNISSPSTAKIPMVPASSILSPTVSEADSDMDPSRRRMRALRAAAPPSAYSTGQKPSQRLSKQP